MTFSSLLIRQQLSQPLQNSLTFFFRPHRNPQTSLTTNLIPSEPNHNLFLLSHLDINFLSLFIIRFAIRSNLSENEIGMRST